MPFPATRLRRLRKTGVLRELVRETTLTPADLVYPMFVQLGEERTPVEAMPGIERMSISNAVEEAGEAHALGIPAVLLFGVPAEKDEQGSGAYDDEGVVQLAVRAIKDAHPDLLVITDVCLCAYTSHGHCGVVLEDGTVDNDLSLELLAKTAISHAARRRRRRRAQRHDGRPRGRAPRAARRRGLQGPADRGLLGEVRLGLLRPVPRGGRLGARRSATGAATRWTRPTPTRRCARRCSTWRRAPTWSWSSRRCRTST